MGYRYKVFDTIVTAIYYVSRMPHEFSLHPVFSLQRVLAKTKFCVNFNNDEIQYKPRESHPGKKNLILDDWRAGEMIPISKGAIRLETEGQKRFYG